jgi:hypothetical protein
VAFGTSGTALTLDSAYLALALDQLPNNFGKADGILGLAYKGLNQAYNLMVYLEDQKINPAVTYPWPFHISNSSTALNQLKSIFKHLRYDDIPPYFDQIESKGMTANKFAFYTLRSFPSLGTKSPESDPLNNGFFILGGGEEQTDLYSGDFVNVDVLDDLYYNVKLKSVQVGNAASMAAASLHSKFKQSQISNAIIDSGTNTLVLTTDVFNSVMSGLKKINPEFLKIIQSAGTAREGIPTSQINFSQWPEINFILTGEKGEDIKLTVTPHNYWQVDCPSRGHALFAMENGNMPISILGLPLMNNYFTVFDRSQDAYGVIRFAAIKRP